MFISTIALVWFCGMSDSSIQTQDGKGKERKGKRIVVLVDGVEWRIIV